MCDFGSLADKLFEAHQLTLASKAAKHFVGGEMQDGADFSVARRHIQTLEKNGCPEQAALLETIVTGATWPRDRLLSCGYVLDAKCPRCHHAVETNHHRCYDCEHNASLQQYLAPRHIALAQRDHRAGRPG